MSPFIARLISVYLRNGYSALRAWREIRDRFALDIVAGRLDPIYTIEEIREAYSSGFPTFKQFSLAWKEKKPAIQRELKFRKLGQDTPPKPKDIPVVERKERLDREHGFVEYEYFIGGRRKLADGVYKDIMVTTYGNREMSALEAYKEYLDAINEGRMLGGQVPYEWEPETYELHFESIKQVLYRR